LLLARVNCPIDVASEMSGLKRVVGETSRCGS